MIALKELFLVHPDGFLVRYGVVGDCAWYLVPEKGSKYSAVIETPDMCDIWVDVGELVPILSDDEYKAQNALGLQFGREYKRKKP